MSHRDIQKRDTLLVGEKSYLWLAPFIPDAVRVVYSSRIFTLALSLESVSLADYVKFTCRINNRNIVLFLKVCLLTNKMI